MSKIILPPSGLAEDILPVFKERQGELHLVTFNLGETYGVPISQVQEIVRITSITNVPNSPVYMEGVINLRGKVLPVLNLRKRLRLSEREPDKSSRVIVAEIGDKIIGLLVDSVSHVIKLPTECIDDAPEEILEGDADYIKGVGKLNERLIILLDLEKLLRRDKMEQGEKERATEEKTTIQGGKR